MSSEQDSSDPDDQIYKQLFNKTSDAIFFHEVTSEGLPGSFLEVNDVACRMLSYSRDELLNLTVREIDTQVQWNRMKSLMDELFQKGYHTFETDLIGRDGISMPCEIHAHLFCWRGKDVILSVARDISDRKKTEKELRDREIQFQTLFESITDGLFIYEIDPSGMPGQFLQVNACACKMFGYSREEIFSMSAKEFVRHEGWKITIPQLLEEFYRTKHVFYESELLTKDGSLFPAEISAYLFELENRPVVLTICRDISRRKNAETVLQDSEKKYRALFNNANDSIFLFEVSVDHLPGRILEANPMACSSLFYTREELLSMTFKDLISDEEWAAYPEVMKRFEKESRITFERNQFRKDGKHFPVEVSAYFFYMDKKPVILSFVRDITERKKAEDFLRASEKFGSSLLDNAPYPMLVIAPDRTIRYVNRAMEVFTGFSSGALLGKKDPYPWWHPDHIDETRGYFLKSFKEGINSAECKFRKKDGSDIWAVITAYSVYEEDQIQYVISNLVDITYRKDAERKLDLYQKKLRELASELDITEERERKDMAVKIHDSVGQTLALLKIKAAMLEDALEKGRGSELAGEIVEGLDEVISFTRDFLFEISPPILYELGFEAAVRWLGDKMLADHALIVEYEDDGLFKPMNEDKKAFLFRSLRELLMNVIKHSEVKEVFVRSYLDGDQILLEVEDRGTGFEVEEIHKNLGSSGSYGLFSIRERVNFLGGRMEIYSRKDRGTLVSISLPVDDQLSGGERHIH